MEKLNEEKLNKIRTFLVDNIYRNPDFMFNDSVRGEDEFGVLDLIEVITDLYELLHIEVMNEPYDYMFHWANKIGAWVETGNFLKLIEGEDE